MKITISAIIIFVSLSSISFADEYVLIMSKNDSLCQNMRQIYNADLRQYGKIKYKMHKEFDWLKWKNKEITLRPPSAPEKCEVCNMNIDAKIAQFDINNDSKDEAVIYSQSMLYGYNIDVYDVFRIDDLKMLDEVVNGEIYYNKTIYSFDSNNGISQNIYEISDDGLKKLPARMRYFINDSKYLNRNEEYFVGGPLKINFVQFKNNFYIAFDGPISLSPGESQDKVGNYSIISKLEQNNKLDNQCLYLIKKEKLYNRRTK